MGPVADDRRLLLVEDDHDMADMVAALLTDEGYPVDVAHDGQRGLHLALSRRHPLMVIDRGLPGIDGLDLLTRLRRVGVTSRILLLTALDDPAQRVLGLDAGADDYLGKPFDVPELLARVRALHRRHLDTAEALPLPAGELDLSRREVRRDGEVIALSGREFALLRLLAASPRTVFPRADLRARLFADTSAESIVDTYVYYLRRKLGPETVRTVRGVGYRMGGA
jgi:two-component system, OmpR family, response regulator QseB